MRVGSLLLGALGGASLWLSFATCAIVQADTRMRIVALPSLWLLALAVTAGGLGARLSRMTATELSPLLLCGVLWLPYLPGQIPPAFLIWNGPIELVVWLVVGVGLAIAGCARRAVRLPALVTDPRLAPWAAGGLAALAYCVGAVSLSERVPLGDEPHYLMITQSLLRDGDLQIENNHARMEFVPFHDNELPPHYVTRGLNGQIYSVHGVGAGALVLPGFALAGYSGASAVIAATTSVAGMLIWHAAWTLTASVAAAWIGWSAVALTAPFFVHAFLVFSDGPGALGVIAGGWLLVQLVMKRSVANWQMVAAGAGLAFLPWLHVRFAILAAGLGLVLCARLLARPHAAAQLGWLLAAPIVSAVAWFGFFWMVWGTPDPRAPIGNVMTTEWRHVWSGTAGLLFDQQFGLIATAPVYLCAAAGLALLAVKQPRLAFEIVLTVVPYALVSAAFETWWGGFGGPARYLVATLPIAALPIAWMWARGGMPARMMTLLALTISVTGLVLRLSVDGGNMIYAETFGTDPLLLWLARSVDLPSALPTMQVAGIWRDVAAWSVATIATMSAAWFVIRRGPESRAFAWSIVSIAAAATAMTGATAVWWLHGTPGVAPAASQLAWAREQGSAYLSTFVQWRKPYVASQLSIARRINVPLSPQPSRKGVAYTLTDVAAGDYELVLTGNVPSRGELVARAGTTGLVFERWPLTGPNQPALRLRLPVSLRQLTVQAEGTDAPLEQVSLRLNGTGLVEGPAVPAAQRAARYGAVRVFFLDTKAYPEAGGFWTQGGDTTEVVVGREDAPGTPLRVRLRSGPVETAVTVNVAGETRQLKLAANSQREEEFAASGPVAVSLRTEAMFLPVQHDPANRDFRHLGVWVEVQ